MDPNMMYVNQSCCLSTPTIQKLLHGVGHAISDELVLPANPNRRLHGVMDNIEINSNQRDGGFDYSHGLRFLGQIGISLGNEESKKVITIDLQQSLFCQRIQMIRV
eukprot:scaffold15992_cov63-Attheya_sp.AAC.3